MFNKLPAELTAFDELAPSLCACNCANNQANFGLANEVPYDWTKEPSVEYISNPPAPSITKSSVLSNCVPSQRALVAVFAFEDHIAKT